MRLFIKHLFKTFIIATVVAIAINCIYYVIVQPGNNYDYKSIVSLIAGSTLTLTVILLIMTLPVLFLANKAYWNNNAVRAFLYFAGPVAFFIAILTLQVSPLTKIFELITALVFMIVHSITFYLLVKKGNS